MIGFSHPDEPTAIEAKADIAEVLDLGVPAVRLLEERRHHGAGIE